MKSAQHLDLLSCLSLMRLRLIELRLLVWLGNYGHLSYEKQQELVWELGAISIGTGTLQKTNQRVAEAIEPAIDDLWKWTTHRPNV